MSYGVGFRVASGVRLRATRRGPRISVGPRIARIHLGGGTPAVSAGRGPVTLWHSLSGGGHEGDGSGAPAIRKEEAWHDQRLHLDALLTAHQAKVTHATPPRLPPPPAVPRSELLTELRRAAQADSSPWNLRALLAARAAAKRALPDELARRERRLAERHVRDQAEADLWWQAMLDADEETVLGRLEAAFDEHAMPATAVAVTDRTAHLVIPVDTPERLIGKREPTVTDKGNLSLARMRKTRRHDLYVQAIGSATLAVAAETFAVAPGIDAVTVAVVAPGHPAGPAVIALAHLDRDTVLPPGADRPAIDDLFHSDRQGSVHVVLERWGQAHAPRPLPTSDPAVRMVLDVLDVE